MGDMIICGMSSSSGKHSRDPLQWSEVLSFFSAENKYLVPFSVLLFDFPRQITNFSTTWIYIRKVHFHDCGCVLGQDSPASVSQHFIVNL